MSRRLNFNGNKIHYSEATYDAEAESLRKLQANFKLLPWQEIVKKAQLEGARHVLLKAGRKTGKTEFMKYDILENAKIAPTVDAQVNAYIAPTRVQAKSIIWRRLKVAVPREDTLFRPRESDLAIDMKNGLRIQLFGSENEDGIRGLTFGRYLLDEADFMRGGFYDEVVGPNLSVTQAGGIISSTPTGKWFTKLWRLVKDGRLGRAWAAFHFTIYDNPYIQRKEIEDIKTKISTEVWEQEYMANENAMSGLQYSEFDGQNHVVPHRTPPQDAIIVRFLDWGWNHPSHCLWAEVYFNKETGRWNLYVFKELSAFGKNVSELVTPILSYDPGRNYLFNVIDESAKRTEIGTGVSIIREFGKCGLVCRTPYGSDDFRINATKMMLRRSDIMISEQCRTLIKQLQDVEWGQKYGDDAADALKYGCSWIYDRDFAHIKAENPFHKETDAPIDPRGLLWKENNLEPDHISWDVVNS